MDTDVAIQSFAADADAEGVAAVCAELGWPSYADPDTARRGCGAPGVTTSVARAGTQVVGFAQVLSDGVVNGYLAQVGVLAPFRRRGIARRLIVAAFEQSGAQRLDLVTDDAQAFSRSFAHQEKPGYRVYPRR